MSDAGSLRNLLKRADMSAPSIQGSAGAMMKHYDKSAKVAVSEWRNALHQARPDQHLPLLYVANETLQNSKRNRGNKFLEAFSPVLGQALIFICQQGDGGVVEKVRRTVKIWAERHVLSVRYVNELLKGLDVYRTTGGGGGAPSSSRPAAIAAPTNFPEDEGGFSPGENGDIPGRKKAVAREVFDIDKELAMDDPNDESSSSESSTNHDDDDDGDIFGSADNRLLNITVDLDRAATTSGKSKGGASKKRRRGSGGTGGSSKMSRRRSIMSTSALMDLWNQVSALQANYDHVQTMLSDVLAPDYLDEAAFSEQVGSLVGEKLTDEYKRTVQFEKRVVMQRVELHKIATKRRALEKEALRYLPWLESQLNQDRDDIELCTTLKQQMEEFETIHGLVKKARDERLVEEARVRKKKEDEEIKQQEEEERKKFLESAMARVTEAEVGMVWNKATQEYQRLETDESWRD